MNNSQLKNLTLSGLGVLPNFPLMPSRLLEMMIQELTTDGARYQLIHNLIGCEAIIAFSYAFNCTVHLRITQRIWSLAFHTCTIASKITFSAFQWLLYVSYYFRAVPSFSRHHPLNHHCNKKVRESKFVGTGYPSEEAAIFGITRIITFLGIVWILILGPLVCIINTRRQCVGKGKCQWTLLGGVYFPMVLIAHSLVLNQFETVA